MSLNSNRFDPENYMSKSLEALRRFDPVLDATAVA